MADRAPDPLAEPPFALSGDGDAGDEPRPVGAAGPVSPPSPLWWAAGVLYRSRWWVVGLTALVAAATVAITLQVPNRYRAASRLLLPESPGGLGGLLSGGSGPAAAALLGGGGGDYERYIAILTSRSAQDHLVERFDLIRHYDLEDHRDPLGAARSELADRSAFDVSLEYEYLSVEVLDEDPGRAAQMANTYVAYLNETNSSMTSASAAASRVYMERRLARAHADMDSLMTAMQGLQEESGLIDPEIQGAAVMSSLAEAQAAVSMAEVQYEMLLSEWGPENPQTRAAATGLQVARSQVARLEAGSESVMPVPLRQLPAVGRRYAELRQQVLAQAEALEQLQPLYEQAVLRERRETDAVQVVDAAVPPVRKAEPRRSIIVVAATASAFVVFAALFLAGAWVRTYAGPLAATLRETSGRVAG